MSVSRGTVHSIQFLRFVAATLVVLFHAHEAITTRVTGVPSATESYLFGFGAIGVHIFFVISGYIMYLTNAARSQPFSAGRFYVRRLIRIYPIYWVFVTLYLAVEAVLGIAPALSSTQIAGMLMLLPGDASRVIGPAWTLSFELYFYFAFGLALLLGVRRGVWALTAAFLICVAVGTVMRLGSTFAAMATSTLLLEFVAGVWVARITTDRRLPRHLGWIMLLMGLGGFVASIAVGYRSYPTLITLGGPSIVLVAGAVILEQTGVATGRVLTRLSVLGDSSYVLYLSHILLITLTVEALKAFSRSGDRLVVTLLVTVIAVGFAHLVHRVIERPLTTMLHRRFR